MRISPPGVTIFGVCVFIVLVGFLHIYKPTINPIHQTLSQYANYPRGVLFDIGIIAVGIGASSLAFALKVAHPTISSVGLGLIITFAVTSLLVGFFHTSPEYASSGGVALFGKIHIVAATLGFISLAMAAIIVNKSLITSYPSSAHSISFFMAAMVIGDLVLALTVLMSNQIAIIGIIERLAFASFLGWLCVVAYVLLPG